MAVYDNEKDDFWNIEKLVPKKKPHLTSFASAVSAREHKISGIEQKPSGERTLSFENYKSERVAEDISYEPIDMGLIKRVSIQRYSDKYDFYGSFRNAALLYYDYQAEKCDFAKFYSYMPQYSQLNSAQKSYYFYWREGIRRGNYIRCDYSYLYLYVYEILNLPDKIVPSEGIVILCRLWREYRTSLPRIDAYFSVWVQDYCLVHNLPCPMAEIRDFIFEVIGASELKEFYLSDMESAGQYGIDALLAYLSDYDWRKGRYATDANAELYSKYMHAAMRIFLSTANATGSAEGAERARLVRDAFAHSLCTHAVKCRLEIEYIPLSSDAVLRSVVTNAVRYTENKLRALFGIRSRLAIKDFSPEHKKIIDSFFDALFVKESTVRRAQNIPEYEKLYDAPSAEMSFAGADEIERASWTNTARLVEGIEDEDNERAEKKNGVIGAEFLSLQVGAATGKTASEPEYSSAETFGLSAEDIEKITAALSGAVLDVGAADRINEAFADGFGDIILEDLGDGYTIIEDYREDISEWLLKITR